jgi:hypothetical protein
MDSAVVPAVQIAEADMTVVEMKWRAYHHPYPFHNSA